MLPLRVVKHLDVIEHVGLCSIPCYIDFPLDAFTLEQLEKAFGHRIVMTIAAPTHATHQAMFFEKGLPVVASELRALVRMNPQSR